MAKFASWISAKSKNDTALPSVPLSIKPVRFSNTSLILSQERYTEIPSFPRGVGSPEGERGEV